MAKTKNVYVCQQCGADSPKWIGKCPSCGEWNTYVEEIIAKESKGRFRLPGTVELPKQKPIRISEVEVSDEIRIDTRNNELNRVLGGGLVPGSLVLTGGEPGIGKSTLVLQVVLSMSGKRTLYVSGEESVKQLKLRAERLEAKNDDCYIVAETSLEQLFVHIQNTQPDIVIVDSIQTISTESIDSSPGSVAQVRECA
ncbi:MAG: AAA family ATPase, partial [Prevotellaceae bacterium]|nr:AAA family ATPase [Prevotellaceae bacterium]